ncbi:MAG TPA: hypothetical protein VGD91_22565 [Trebonia sp.]
MAGGEFAKFVPCGVCMGTGVLTRAKRTKEGVEDDQYRCRKWHRFGMDWHTGPATGPQWPVSDEIRDALSELRRSLR